MPSIDELNALGERVRQAVDDRPGASVAWCQVDGPHGYVSVGVEAEDFSAVEELLVGTFGELVNVSRLEHLEWEQEFEVWWFDEATLELTIEGTASSKDEAWHLRIVETSQRIAATAVAQRRIVTPRSSRAREGLVVPMVGYAKKATARLAAPLGEREVIDTSSGTTRTRHELPYS